MSGHADGSAVPPNPAPATAPAPLPVAYSLACDTAEMQLVAVLVCNSIAIHLRRELVPPSAFALGPDVDVGASDDMENFARKGVDAALIRFGSQKGPDGFRTLADRCTRLLLASLKQEGA